jgi:beta-glucanase (GH16 family)
MTSLGIQEGSKNLMWKFAMRIAVPALAALLAISSLTVAGDAATTYSSTPAFSADFGGSAVDTNTWIAQDTRYSGFTDANRDCFMNAPSLISQSNGMVHLTARRLASAFYCKSPYGGWWTRYAASTIATRGHYSQAYGRFEFRARMPQTTVRGLHAALWLYPAANTYGAWPRSGEIDVTEWFSNRPTIALNALHYAGNTDNAGISCRTATPGSFHDYAVEWKSGVMTFFLDGQPCWQHSWTAYSVLPGQAPFDKPFYFVLSMGFGSGDNAPVSTTPAASTMDVEWVRSWTR